MNPDIQFSTVLRIMASLTNDNIPLSYSNISNEVYDNYSEADINLKESLNNLIKKGYIHKKFLRKSYSITNDGYIFYKKCFE